jgi:hypothetical protein
MLIHKRQYWVLVTVLLVSVRILVSFALNQLYPSEFVNGLSEIGLVDLFVVLAVAVAAAVATRHSRSGTKKRLSLAFAVLFGTAIGYGFDFYLWFKYLRFDPDAMWEGTLMIYGTFSVALAVLFFVISEVGCRIIRRLE